jgi:hypothetical protein
MDPHPSHRLAACLIAVAVAAGCSVRDEQPRQPRAGGWWPAPAVGPGPGGLIAAAPDEQPGTGVIEYVEGYEAGSRRALDARLPMLVVFRAGWCQWSAEFVQAAVADRGLVELTRRFVCVAVDADRDAATCREFGVQAFPTVILLDADRRERFRGTGSSASAELATAMRDLLGDRSQRVAADAAQPLH